MSFDRSIFSSEIRSIAVLSDIHGNIRALNAVLDDVAERDIDAVVCNGDFVTSSAHSVEVVERIFGSSGFPAHAGTTNAICRNWPIRKMKNGDRRIGLPPNTIFWN